MKYKRRKPFYVLFFLLILLSCFQQAVLVDFGSFSLKIFHVYAVIFVFFMVIHKKFLFPPRCIVIFYLYMLLHSIIMSSKWSIGNLLVNYTFGMYLLSVFITFGKEFEMEDWCSMFRAVAIVMIIAVIINIVLQFDDIIYFFNNTWLGHPTISTIWGGGVNLDSTWLALMGFAFLKHKFKWIYIFTSTAISAVLASRTGMVINVMCLLWIIIAESKNKDIIKSIRRILISGSLVVAALLIALHYGLLDVVLERFVDIGEDKGSLGRENMWQYAYETMITYPLGCGIGNNMKALTSVAGVTFPDGNMHNLYIQNIIDLGWFGGIWYIIMIIVFIIKERKRLWKDPFVAMLYVYIATSMIQFRGGEPLTFCILGIFLSTNRYEKLHYSNEEEISANDLKENGAIC